MERKIRSIGLDVHSKFITVGIADEGREPAESQQRAMERSHTRRQQ